ncbi:Gustatory receptor 40a [Halyomorpha halys]|nr:Gustatory receptor 40a [Halyomorpha halys]
MDSIRVRNSRRRRVEKVPLCNHVQLVFRLSALFGMSPIKLEKRKSKFSYTLAVYSIFISFLILYLGIINFLFTLEFFNDKALAIIMISSIPIYTALQISSVIDSFFNASGFGYIIEELKIIDKKFFAIGVKKEHRHHWFNGLMEIFMTTFYIVCDTSFRNHFSFSFLQLGTICYALISSQIFSLGSHILSRHELILHTLEQLNGIPQNINHMIENLLGINHQLFKIINTFSSCYRLQFLVLTTYTLHFVTSRLYIIFLLEGVNVLRVFLLYTIIYYCIIFGRIIRCSSFIMKKSKDFDKLLYQLMINDENGGLLDNPKLQLHIAIKKYPTITACGFFVLDFSLIQTMAASVTTYLVMFIQCHVPVAPRPSH